MNIDFIIYANATFAKNTCESYFTNINAMLKYVGKHESEITQNDILGWVNNMADRGLANSSRKQHLDCVKTYFKFLVKRKLLNENPAEDVDVLNVSNKPKHHMDKEMVKDMVLHAKSNRDKAIILLYTVSGARVSEMTNLTVSQYLNMRANGDNKIHIVGKRDKHRFIYFNQQVIDAVDKYLVERTGAKCDNLFITNQGNPIARNNLNVTLKRIAKSAGVPFWEDMCNHQLRAGCATIYYENGMKLHDLQQLLGHSNVETTLRYTKSSEDKISQQVALMDFS